MTASAVRYEVVHRTAYSYARPMTDGYTVTRLLLRDTDRQRVLSSAVDVTPTPDERDERLDAFGNRVLRFGVHRPHDALLVESRSCADVTMPPSPDSDVTWEEAAAGVAGLVGEEALDVGAFAGSSAFVDLARHGDELERLSARSFPAGARLLDGVAALCNDIRAGFEYDPTSTELSTPLGEVLAVRRGVCQDFAHLAVGCLRVLGLAARYVSGYVDPAPAGGPTSAGAGDASHAWCAVWVPGQGWLQFDPTNDQVPARHHVVIGWGRDYGDVAPVRGVVIGPVAEQSLSVDVRVTRVRPTAT